MIKKLQPHIPIARAKMKVQITVPQASVKQIKRTLESEEAEVVEESKGDTVRLVVLINPGSYRVVDSLVHELGTGNELSLLASGRLSYVPED